MHRMDELGDGDLYAIGSTMDKEIHRGLQARLTSFSHSAKQRSQSFSVWSLQWSDEDSSPAGDGSVIEPAARKIA